MFKVNCDAIQDGGRFPELFRGPGHGANVCPTLSWSDAPEGTVWMAVTLTDDDAPGYVHLVATVAASAGEFSAFQTDESIRLGQGTRMLGYEGPCPPAGVHHYRFTLRALSADPGLAVGFSAEQLEAAIDGTVLGTATLQATYNTGIVRMLEVQGGRVINQLRKLRVA